MGSLAAGERPPRILLLCPDALGPQACCVEDALRARGYSVWVEQGRRARRWVRNVPSGGPTIRVLCVPTIDPAYAQRLCQGRPDFHIVGMTTPREVVDRIEAIVGRHRSSRVPRPSRMILAQPTLMEQSLHAEQRWGRGVATAVGAVALVVIGGMLGAWVGRAEPSEAARPGAPAVVRVRSTETVTPARLRDEPVLSAVAPVDPEVLRGLDEDEREGSERAQRSGTSIVPSR
ncbi:MAG: hypothetical protein KDK70_10335 [Myxococcales bacterium]|nr:hypothetical protein [Myxococcales bacterium]